MMRRLRTALEMLTAFAIPASWFVGLLALAMMHRVDLTEPTVVLKRDAPVARYISMMPEGRPNGEKKATAAAEEKARSQPAQAAESQKSDSESAIAMTTPHTRTERASAQQASILAARNRTGDGTTSDRSRSAREARGGQRKGKKCDADDPRVAQLDAFEFGIDASVFDYYTSHIIEADALAWTNWHKDSRGKVDGFKVTRMGCGNILRQAGLRNGDVVHRINDVEVRSLSGALKAYRKLNDKRVLRLTITRKDGSRVKLVYKLR